MYNFYIIVMVWMYKDSEPQLGKCLRKPGSMIFAIRFSCAVIEMRKIFLKWKSGNVGTSSCSLQRERVKVKGVLCG